MVQVFRLQLNTLAREEHVQITEINQSELASLLGLSRARVSQICDEPECPINKSGIKGKGVRINLPKFIKWWLSRHLKKELAQVKNNSGEGGSKEEEEKRLIVARSRKLELETRILQGKLVPIEDVQMLLGEVANNYAAGLESLPGRLSNSIGGMTDPAEIKEKVFSEVRRVRNYTAQKLNGFRPSGTSGEEHGEDGGRAVTKDSGSVGGRKKNPAKGKRRTRTV